MKCAFDRVRALGRTHVLVVAVLLIEVFGCVSESILNINGAPYAGRGKLMTLC